MSLRDISDQDLADDIASLTASLRQYGAEQRRRASVKSVESIRDEIEELHRQLASPPEGWFTFGTHIDRPEVQLEFWGDDDGLPLWERPKRP